MSEKEKTNKQKREIYCAFGQAVRHSIMQMYPELLSEETRATCACGFGFSLVSSLRLMDDLVA